MPTRVTRERRASSGSRGGMHIRSADRFIRSTRGSYQPFSSWKSATNMWSVNTVPKVRSASLGFGLCAAAFTIRMASVMVLLLLEDDRFPIEAEDLTVHVGDLAQ